MSNISTCEKGKSMASCLQIGVSSFLWRQQHVVGHHTHTNLETDPDIRASDQDVRRVAPPPQAPVVSCAPLLHSHCAS